MDLPVRPLPGGFGAVVECDLGAAGASGPSPLLVRALHRFRFLVFPGQHLNHADLLATAECFGTVDTDVDRRYSVGGFPGITAISNIVEHDVRVGIYDGDQEEEWHADGCFKPTLPRATLLYSVITPQHGGLTRFADATRAFADLPAAQQRRIEGLRAVHSVQRLATQQALASAGQSSAAAGSLNDRPEVEHPLAPEHPVTGARSLLLGPMVISSITGLSPQASSSLLAELTTHATSPPYVYSHRWGQGDLVVWDNRATLHTASPCDSSRHHRLLYRASVN